MSSSLICLLENVKIRIHRKLKFNALFNLQLNARHVIAPQIGCFLNAWHVFMCVCVLFVWIPDYAVAPNRTVLWWHRRQQWHPTPLCLAPTYNQTPFTHVFVVVLIFIIIGCRIFLLVCVWNELYGIKGRGVIRKRGQNQTFLIVKCVLVNLLLEHRCFA